MHWVKIENLLSNLFSMQRIWLEEIARQDKELKIIYVKLSPRCMCITFILTSAVSWCLWYCKFPYLLAFELISVMLHYLLPFRLYSQSYGTPTQNFLTFAYITVYYPVYKKNTLELTSNLLKFWSKHQLEKAIDKLLIPDMILIWEFYSMIMPNANFNVWQCRS